MLIIDSQENEYIFNGSFLRIWSHRSKIPLFKLKNVLGVYIEKIFEIYENISLKEVLSLARTRMYHHIKKKLQEHPLSRKELRESKEWIENLGEVSPIRTPAPAPLHGYLGMRSEKPEIIDKRKCVILEGFLIYEDCDIIEVDIKLPLLNFEGYVSFSKKRIEIFGDHVSFSKKRIEIFGDPLMRKNIEWITRFKISEQYLRETIDRVVLNGSIE